MRVCHKYVSVCPLQLQKLDPSRAAVARTHCGRRGTQPRGITRHGTSRGWANLQTWLRGVLPLSRASLTVWISEDPHSSTLIHTSDSKKYPVDGGHLSGSCTCRMPPRMTGMLPLAVGNRMLLRRYRATSSLTPLLLRRDRHLVPRGSI
jgi:hypothetical protein